MIQFCSVLIGIIPTKLSCYRVIHSFFPLLWDMESKTEAAQNCITSLISRKCKNVCRIHPYSITAYAYRDANDVTGYFSYRCLLRICIGIFQTSPGSLRQTFLYSSKGVYSAAVFITDFNHLHHNLIIKH